MPGFNKLNEILKEFSMDITSVLKDYLFTEILARIADFKAEVEYFEKKYGKSFEEVQKEYLENEENFEIYEDLMAWEFAIEGLKYCEKKLNELKSVFADFRKTQGHNQELPGQKF